MDEQDEALRARAEARLGTTLQGKYRLDRVLGIGGMATVFAATHRNQAELAVKVLHAELSLRDDLRKRFLREGYVGNSVKHPGAVLVVDDDIAEDGSAFLVMELLRGRSLEDLWEREGRRLTTRVVTALGIQLLEVLAAAHANTIIHRDLKPANLFLSVDGTLKVLDFGIARLRDAVGGSEHATRTGTLMGTPAFMAPEQAQAVAAEIDGQTDLWAVGATMYTLLSGQLVHDGDNSSQLLIKAGTTRARPLLSVAPDVEPAIADVVDRALTFEKRGRWPNADAMREALVSAAVVAFGAPPGRDVLVSVLGPEGRRSDVPQTDRGSSGPRASGATPRLVVKGEVDIRANDPTFANPAGSVPPPHGGPVDPRPRASSGPLPGVSTANPVSAEFVVPGLRTGSGKRSKLPWAALLVVVGSGLVFAFVHSRGTTEPPAQAVAPTVTASAPLPSATVVATAPEAPAVPVPPVETAAPPAVPPPPPVAVAPAPAPKPKHGGASSAAAKAAAAAAVDCSTPYTLDSDGNKKWKLECVQH